MERPHAQEVLALLTAREAALSPLAARGCSSRGRLQSEEPSPLRTEFQRDRDRIIHSNAFRRLKHKTQVFIAAAGDHYVTRLTHTLEVAQVARTVVRALNLNEDLAEAIALGHDLGHTPFGHAGESALAALLPGGFRHNEQSLRVVDRLENGGRGLNLTWETRDGIRHHSKPRSDLMESGDGALPATLEGQAVRLADSVAYLNHDIGDAVRAGVIREQDLPPSTIRILGPTHARRIDTLVGDIVDASWPDGVHPPAIRMSDEVAAAANELREFMFARVYTWEERVPAAERAREVIRALFDHYVKHPEDVPPEFMAPQEGPERRAADYISGMTDFFALAAAESLQLM